MLNFTSILARALILAPTIPRGYNLSNRLWSQSTLPSLVQNYRGISSASMDPRINELVSYWCDRDPMEWFNPPAGLDDEIRTRYGALISDARANSLDNWAETPKGTLALILLLDQFPRNIFRGSGESYSSDNKALSISVRAVAQRFDQQAGEESVLRQLIFYLPFIHAEDLTAQVAGRALYENTMLRLPENSEHRKLLENGVEFSQRHVDCVFQHGRFPKRNEPIGRRTTEEEQKFLEEHPEGF